MTHMCSSEMYFRQFWPKHIRTQLLQSESQLFAMRHARNQAKQIPGGSHLFQRTMDAHETLKVTRNKN